MNKSGSVNKAAGNLEMMAFVLTLLLLVPGMVSASLTWTQATSAANWAERDYHASVVFNSNMWVLGGLNNGGTGNYNDVWSSSDGATWTQATSSAGW